LVIPNTSSGLEGALILIAAASSVAAWDRLLSPQPLEQVGLGLGLTLASAINGGVALILQSWETPAVTLRADAHHLLTDVDFGWRCWHRTSAINGWLI